MGNSRLQFDPRPLLEQVGYRPGAPECITVKEAAIRLGLNPRVVARYTAGQWISWQRADRLANRLGLHPADIWGDLWYQSLDEDDVAS